MVLCNAIYFKANWQSQFDPSETRELDFHVGDGTLDRVWMMRHRRLRGIKYAAFDGNGAQYLTPYETYPDEDVTTCYPDQFGFQVVSRPYQGERLSCSCSFRNGLTDSLESNHSSTKPGMLEKWITSFIPFTVNLSMPKVRIRSDLDLVPTLIDMGMVRAFTSPLEPMVRSFPESRTAQTRRSAFCQSSPYSAVIELSETGTEATAAHANQHAVYGTRTGYAAVRTHVNANRPFLFAIRDELSGTILFLGKIVKQIEVGKCTLTQPINGHNFIRFTPSSPRPFAKIRTIPVNMSGPIAGNRVSTQATSGSSIAHLSGNGNSIDLIRSICSPRFQPPFADQRASALTESIPEPKSCEQTHGSNPARSK